MFSLIAAVGKNNELGKNNHLIWDLPLDLKFFKEKTMNKTIIMGYKTYLSLPKKLVGRKYIVLSSNHPDLGKDIKVYNNKEDLLEALKDNDEEIFIIGGATVYREFIDLCDYLYLTEIEAEDRNADVYFPYFDKNKYTSQVIDSKEENKIKYKHLVYRRK